MPPRKIPVCVPYLSGNEEKYVLDAVRTAWISSAGRYLNEFEKGFASYLGVKHATACNNGTTALHLALAAAGIGPGDEVIMQDFTMIATGFAIAYCGAKPVLVDVEPETWNIDVSKVEAKLTPKTKALLVAHIYGHPADMDPLIELCKRRKILLIEDAAEVHGALYKNRKCGSLSDIASFSFYANKIITTGEGGMVVSDNKELFDKARYFKNLCFPLDGERDYLHHDIGFNYRMGNLQAALGLAQLEKIDEYIERRRKNAQLYNSMLASVSVVQTPAEKSWAKNVYWMYGIVLDEKAKLGRDAFRKKLAEDGIETRPFFNPMHKQPSLKKFNMGDEKEFPVSERLGKQGLYLPSSTNLAEEEIRFICDKVKAALS